MSNIPNWLTLEQEAHIGMAGTRNTRLPMEKIFVSVHFHLLLKNEAHLPTFVSQTCGSEHPLVTCHGADGYGTLHKDVRWGPMWVTMESAGWHTKRWRRHAIGKLWATIFLLVHNGRVVGWYLGRGFRALTQVALEYICHCGWIFYDTVYWRRCIDILIHCVYTT
jgi:hypothetical protein